MAKETDLTELNKLEQLLKAAGIPYQREDKDLLPPEEVDRLKYVHYFDFHQICYPAKLGRKSDVICHYGSYGWTEGLLEQMGLLPPDAGDTVQVLRNTLTGEQSVGWWPNGENPKGEDRK